MIVRVPLAATPMSVAAVKVMVLLELMLSLTAPNSTSAPALLMPVPASEIVEAVAVVFKPNVLPPKLNASSAPLLTTTLPPDVPPNAFAAVASSMPALTLVPPE